MPACSPFQVMRRPNPAFGALALTFLLIGARSGSAMESVGAITPPRDASCVVEISRDLVEIEGGRFDMGDLFAEGELNELPVHTVTLDGFRLARHEVTRRQFAEFVEGTGYRTSAQAAPNPARQQELIEAAMPLIQAGKDEEAAPLIEEFLSFGGCFWWSPEAGGFDFSADCNWLNPLFDQSESDPAICLSWLDAARFCNWLSREASLPVAYDLPSGDLLDGNGDRTPDIGAVLGYRLPSEAEWEFAARERGRVVRFGNGRDIARSSEIVFDSSRGDFDYVEVGDRRVGTEAVGSREPNSLGLFDMSGNAWEWCSNSHAAYEEESQSNPHANEGRTRAIRGGRWGGTAKEMRVSARAPYEPANRCNNSGFRVARSWTAQD